MRCRALRLKGRGSLEGRRLVAPVAAFSLIGTDWLPAACLPACLSRPSQACPSCFFTSRAPTGCTAMWRQVRQLVHLYVHMSMYDVVAGRVLAGAVNRQ